MNHPNDPLHAFERCCSIGSLQGIREEGARVVNLLESGVSVRGAKISEDSGSLRHEINRRFSERGFQHRNSLARATKQDGDIASVAGEARRRPIAEKSIVGFAGLLHRLVSALEVLTCPPGMAGRSMLLGPPSPCVRA